MSDKFYIVVYDVVDSW